MMINDPIMYIFGIIAKNNSDVNDLRVKSF